MKRSLTLLFGNLLFLLSFAEANDTLTLKKAYQGKNIFVQNPFAPSLQSFCTIKVLVNDSTIMDSIQTSAYEIDLSFIRINETVKIQIVHQSGCLPKVLNPISYPKRAFQFLTFNPTEQEWSFVTKGEAIGEIIVVECFQNNSWVQTNEIPAKGSAILNKYSLPAMNHSGKNKIRLRHMGGDGYLTYSPVVEYTSSLPVLTYARTKEGDLLFSREVYYELLNETGKLIEKGTALTVSLRKKSSAIYYIYADNQIFKIRHKMKEE